MGVLVVREKLGERAENIFIKTSFQRAVAEELHGQ